MTVPYLSGGEVGKSPIKLRFPNSGDNVEAIVERKWPSNANVVINSLVVNEHCNQHLNSPAHAPVYECDECDRWFGSQQSLNQHLNSPANAPLYKCDECDGWLGSPQALQQHYKSPAHAPVYKCDECARSFGSQQALNQHLGSQAHVFECNNCDLSFRNQQSLNLRCTYLLSDHPPERLRYFQVAPPPKPDTSLQVPPQPATLEDQVEQQLSQKLDAATAAASRVLQPPQSSRFGCRLPNGPNITHIHLVGC